MQLPHLRTNYGNVSGFFSLVNRGEPKVRAYGSALRMNDKSSSFSPVRVLGVEGNEMDLRDKSAQFGCVASTRVFTGRCYYLREQNVSSPLED